MDIKMVYLDNASTTKPKFFRSTYKDFWMNSNTPYTRTEEQVELEKAKEKIKSCLSVKNGYVITGGNTTKLITDLLNYMSKKV